MRKGRRRIDLRKEEEVLLPWIVRIAPGHLHNIIIPASERLDVHKLPKLTHIIHNIIIPASERY